MVALEKAPDLSPVFGPRGKDFLDRAVAALVERAPVAEIWLFGSCARGTARGDSDIDLLVVLEDSHRLKNPLLECFKIVNHLPQMLASDVLATTRSQWEFEKTHPFGILGDVAKEGICLYAK
jgi:uncharacterized protein